MVDGKLLQRIVVWPTYEDAITAEQEAASADCKRTNRLTVWDTYEQAAAHVTAGSGGGGGYHADAVDFDGTAGLSIDMLSCTDNGLFSLVMFFKTTNTASQTMAIEDPHNNGFTVIGVHGSTGQYAMSFYGVGFADGMEMYTDEAFNDGAWHSVVSAFNFNFDAGSRKLKIYIDNEDATDVVIDNGNAFQPLFAGQPFFIGLEGNVGPTAYIGSFADMRIMPGVSLLDETGDIPLATRRLFVTADNKPADPAIATAALGAAGAMLFSGDATTFTTNQGTGGAFTLTGTLTNASTSPSD